MSISRYFIDTPTPTEAVSIGNPDGYAFVIRRYGMTGWVFRFLAIDERGARETLTNLNHPCPKRAAA